MKYSFYYTNNNGVIKYISKGSDIKFDNEEDRYNYWYKRWEDKKKNMTPKEKKEYEWEMNMIRWME